MPKRSNNFQRLIYLIHHQLANDAVVTESKFLRDSAAEAEREVDIVIETTVGEYSLTISIECRDRGRVADIEWVEQMIAKHHTLPTNKLILISSSGFTKRAAKKAQAQGVQTLSLSQAAQANWNVLTGIGKVGLVKFTVEYSAYFALLEETSFLLDKDQEIHIENEGFIFTVEELVSRLSDLYLEKMWGNEKLSSDYKEGKYFVFTCDFPLPENEAYMWIEDIKCFIHGIKVLGHYTYETELVSLENKSFGSAQVAFGHTQQIDKESLISIVEHKDKPDSAALMFASENKDSTHIVTLRPVNQKKFK
jgi:hypothetical protein